MNPGGPDILPPRKLFSVYARHKYKNRMQHLPSINANIEAKIDEATNIVSTASKWMHLNTWNSLPTSLRQITSYGQFRRYLITHLFWNWEITAQHNLWFSVLYKYSYLLTYLPTKQPQPDINKKVCKNIRKLPDLFSTAVWCYTCKSMLNMV